MKMKRFFVLALSVLMLVSVVTACGGPSEDEGTAQEPIAVDLLALYNSMAAKHEFGEGYMADLTEEPEMLESYYPGLSESETAQLVIRVPVISAGVNEIALVECKDEATADQVEQILRDRATSQAEGGALYPESTEAWGNSAVIRQGNYMALIASAEWQNDLADEFNAAFVAE